MKDHNKYLHINLSTWKTPTTYILARMLDNISPLALSSWTKIATLRQAHPPQTRLTREKEKKKRIRQNLTLNTNRGLQPLDVENVQLASQSTIH